MALSKVVRQWLRYALDDLRVARTIEGMGSSYWRACAYHSQQAVEKAIKGHLTFHRVRFTKTHNLELLLKDVATIDAKFAKRMAQTERLTKLPSSTATRTPSLIQSR